MALFQGAIGVFKNPTSQRQVDYCDTTIASEIVLFADLLLRMLDERAEIAQETLKRHGTTNRDKASLPRSLPQSRLFERSIAVRFAQKVEGWN